MLSAGQCDLAFLDQDYGKDSAYFGTDVTRAYRLSERLLIGHAPRPRTLIVGYTSFAAGDGEFDERAKAAGQDAVWPKQLPPQEEMQRRLHVLLCRDLADRGPVIPARTVLSIKRRQ